MTCPTRTGGLAGRRPAPTPSSSGAPGRRGSRSPRLRRPGRASRRGPGRSRAGEMPPAVGLADEAVHLPAVDVLDRVDMVVGPARLAVGVVWYGLTQWCPYGSGTQTVGMPLRIGIPSAPGNVPKNESKDLFSCMMITTCLILWIPVAVAPRATARVCRPPPGAEPERRARARPPQPGRQAAPPEHRALTRAQARQGSLSAALTDVLLSPALACPGRAKTARMRAWPMLRPASSRADGRRGSRRPTRSTIAHRGEFSVASIVARTADTRRHLTAIYGYARLVDQIGDARRRRPPRRARGLRGGPRPDLRRGRPRPTPSFAGSPRRCASSTFREARSTG